MSGKRSPKGEGSVYQRKSDGLWVAAVTLPSGRRTVAYGKSDREALKKRRDLLIAVEAGKPFSAGRTPTLGKYLVHWLSHRISSEVEAGHLRATTADSYRQVIRIHVLPTPLAGINLKALTTEDIREWQRAKLKEKSARGTKISPRTVGMAHAVIRRALNNALGDDELVTRNVAALVPLPAGQKVDVVPPTDAEITAVFATLTEGKYTVLWLVMLGLGLRKGEALALRWSQIDLDARTVRIRKQILREREMSDTTGRRRGRLVEVNTKTPESKATMMLPKALVTILRDHQDAQTAERDKARVWLDADLVFTTSVGTPIEPRNVNRKWLDVCKDAGVRLLRVHDLRHGAASLAFAEGSSIKEVQEMLRHSRSSTTSDIYVHVLESVRQGTADTMDSIMNRVRKA